MNSDALFHKKTISLEEIMHTGLMIVLIIASLVLIASILMQTGNSDGLSGSIAGGAEQLFGKKKSRGYDALLARITTVSAIIYIVLSMGISILFMSQQ